MTRSLRAFVVLALLLAGCSSGAGPRSSSADGASSGASSTSQPDGASGTSGPSGKAGAGRQTPLPPILAASPIAKDFSPVDRPAPPVANRKPVCQDEFQPDSPVDEHKSWIHAVIDRDADFGAKCPSMAPGQECWIPFTGGWGLKETPTGSIVFQVFENDDAAPARSPEAGPVASGGHFTSSTRLRYTPSTKAKKATIRAFLKDAAGRIVAESVPQTVPVPLCGAPQQ